MVDPARIKKLLEIKSWPHTKVDWVLTPDINVDLDPYQQQAILFGEAGLHTFNSDEAGLGKTLTALGLFSHLRLIHKAKKCVVVSLASAVLNTWKEEILDNTSFNPVIVLGEIQKTKKGRYSAYEQVNAMAPIMVTNYEIFKADYLHPLYTEADLIIFDESSGFKSYNTVVAKAARYVSERVKYVNLLNATPVEKDLLDFHSQAEALYPGMLGTVEQFTRRYCKVMMQEISRYNPRAGRAYSIKVPKIVGAKNLDELKAKTGWMMINRTPDEVGIKYPKVEPQVLELPMSEEQYRVYNSLKYGTLKRYGKIKKVDFGVKFGYMVLSCVSPCLVTKKDYKPGESPKYDAIRVLAKKLKAANERFVVFSRFQVTLNLLEEILKAEGYRVGVITGKIKSKAVRRDAQNAFNAGKVDMLLMNMAGAKSLNLPGARFIAFIDSTFNPATNKQVIYRLCRRTQESDKVFVYVFIIKGTIEKGILKMLGGRQEVSDVFMSNKNPLTIEEMQKIFLEDVDAAKRV